MTSSNLDCDALPVRRLLPWTIVISGVIHGVLLASLVAAPAPRVVKRPVQLRFDVVSARTSEPKPAPVPEPPRPDPPRPARAPAPQPVAAPAPAPAPVATEPPPVETPSTGVTLAAEGPSNDLAMPLGNGGALEPTRPRTVAPVPVLPPRPVPVASEPALVPIGDLSSRPSPPALGAALERYYPPDARRGGTSGSAKVRARIDPDGVVRRVALLDESGAGFGSACTRALQGSQWGAPKDKAGRSVATEIRYTCRFVVQP